MGATPARPIGNSRGEAFPAPILRTTTNGLRIIGVPLPGLHQVVLNATLHVGSRYETPTTNGVSHFLEHMLFRGTPTHPTSHLLADAFESLGGTLVAATAADTGTLAVGTPPESFHSMLNLFAEVFRSPVFSEIETEKGIVAEEILEGLGENGACVDPQDLIRAVCFADHPLGMSIIGNAELLESFNVELLRSHHAAHYTAANTVVAVAGPIDERLVDAVQAAFEGVPTGTRHPLYAPTAQTAARFEYVRNSTSQTALRVGFRAPAITAADEPAMDLLLRTLDDGMSTRLYAELCDKRGLCYDVSADYEGYADTGLVEIGAECAHDNAGSVLEALLDVVKRLREDGPTAAELQKAKRRYGWDAVQLVDSVADVAEHYALGTAQGMPTDVRERQRVMEALTTEDVRAAAQTWWRPEHLSVVAVGQQAKRSAAKLEKLAAEFR